MSLSNSKILLLAAGALLACLGVGTARATSYTDNFTGNSAQLQWTPLGDACLTAGNGNGSIPSCSSKGFLTDSTGQGALLLTPAQDDQTGAILSAFPPFPMSQGIQITFTTYTFGGDSGGLAKNGADGIVFILTDGTQKNPPTTTGAEGGSMGYDCSNGNSVYDGIAYGYLGLGIDEFGNFLNTGDNGSVGIYNSNDPNGTTANGTNSYYSANGGSISAGTGPQYQPERIGLRGAGNTNWAWLQRVNPTYYSGSSNATKVQWACKHGEYVSGYTYDKYGNVTGKTYASIPYNYNAIPGGYAVLPDNEPIANNSKSATRNPPTGTPGCVGNSPACNIAWPITYRLTISSGGLLNFDYSYNNGAFQPVLANHDITQDNGPLPSLLRFGFSAGTGGDNNVHEITCFQASPLQASASVAANTTPGGRVIAGTQVFVPSYSTNNWWGSLQAIQVMTNPTTGSITFNTVATWDAKCVLTGGPCDSMGVNANGTPINSVPVQSPANRTLLTSNALGASAGIALTPSNFSSLSTAQQTALNVATSNSLDATPGTNRVAWLTGDRSVEQLYGGNGTIPACSPTPAVSPPCDLRARTYVLGDIINSSPAFVGAPTPGMYPDTFQDDLDPTDPNYENSTPANPTTPYSQFASSNASRENVVYVGSNDGFLHGFQAGSYSGATYDSSTNNGEELVGYMPYDVLLDKAANLTNPLYVHDYLVDATPGTGDLFYGGTWHTWLVGGVGSAGSEIYALNITNPATASDASNFSASDVIGDWDSSTLTHLGNTVGTPAIVRMHNGDWAFIFGSGLVSQGTASPPTEGVYIGLVDPSSGAVTFQFLDTGVAPTVTNAAGGIAYVTPADLDGDHITDYLYAGDTQGNVWRFDVTSANPTQWSGASATNPPIVVYKAEDASGTPQPITTSLQLGLVTTGSGTTETRVMIYFGTGQLTQQSASSAALYVKGTQTFYGVWDWNMSGWNAKSSVQYASLSAPQTVTRSDLVAQTVTATTPANGSNPATRSLSNLTVCWADQGACSGTPQYGWLFDLPDPGPTTGANAGTSEQIIYNPTIIGGEIVVNTATPPVVNASQCNPGVQEGWTMAFDPETGGAIPGGFFGNNASGLGNGAVGTSTGLQNGGNLLVVSNAGAGSLNGAGGPIGNPGHPKAGNAPGRVSWRELVNP